MFWRNRKTANWEESMDAVSPYGNGLTERVLTYTLHDETYVAQVTLWQGQWWWSIGFEHNDDEVASGKTHTREEAQAAAIAAIKEHRSKDQMSLFARQAYVEQNDDGAWDVVWPDGGRTAGLVELQDAVALAQDETMSVTAGPKFDPPVKGSGMAAPPAGAQTEVNINGRWLRRGGEFSVKGESGRFTMSHSIGDEVTAFGGSEGREAWRTFKHHRIDTVHTKEKRRSAASKTAASGGLISTFRPYGRGKNARIVLHASDPTPSRVETSIDPVTQEGKEIAFYEALCGAGEQIAYESWKTDGTYGVVGFQEETGQPDLYRRDACGRCVKIAASRTASRRQAGSDGDMTPEEIDSMWNANFWRGQAENARRQEEARKRLWAMKGQEVVVVKGRKIPIGTRGTCFFSGEGQWGWRIGFTTSDGQTYWTDVRNVELASEAKVGAREGDRRCSCGYTGHVENFRVPGGFQCPSCGKRELPKVQVTSGWLQVERLSREEIERRYPIQPLAHQSADPTVVSHCPFCGSGNVIARSDGNVECTLCNRQFTITEQPTFSGMPGETNDAPADPSDPDLEVPASDAEIAQAPPFLPPGSGGEPERPTDQPDAPEASNPAGDSKQPPWLNKGSSLRTSTGARLDDDAMALHLALRHGDREAILAQRRG